MLASQDSKSGGAVPKNDVCRHNSPSDDPDMRRMWLSWATRGLLDRSHLLRCCAILQHHRGAVRSCGIIPFTASGTRMLLWMMDWKHCSRRCKWIDPRYSTCTLFRIIFVNWYLHKNDVEWRAVQGVGGISCPGKSESTNAATKPVPFLENERTNYAGLAKDAHKKQWTVVAVLGGATTTGPDATPPPSYLPKLAGGGGGAVGAGGGRREGGGWGYWQLGRGGGGGLRATHYYHMHISRGCLGAWGY